MINSLLLHIRNALGRVGAATLFGFAVRLIACVLGVLSAVVLPCSAAGGYPGKVVMVIAGGISVRDLAAPELFNTARLLAKGSGGLMNVRTGRPNKLMEPTEQPGMESGCLTLGAGAMAVGGAEVRRAANAGQMIGSIPAAQLWSCRTGNPITDSEVVHTEIALIQRVNQAATYRAKPGLLGGTLRSNGILSGVVGCSTIPGEPHAECAAAAMDSQGLVACGDVSSPRLLEPDPHAPFGVRTNQVHLVAQFDRALAKCGFVVVDVGDTYRADRYAQYCTDAQAQALRRWAVKQLDKLIGAIASRLDFSNDTLILLAPSPRTFSEIPEERLSPIIICGPGFRGGVLSSPSTRRKGLVTICDVAPTVLSAFHLQAPPEMTGRPIYAVECRQPLDFLLSLNLRASLQGQRQVLVRAASVLQSVVVVLATMGLLAGSMRVRCAAAWAALLPLALTLAVLFAPVLYSGGLPGTAAVVLFGTAALVVIFSRVFKTPMRVFVWLCGFLVLSILVDLMRGAQLASSSVAGYGLLEGARYYGLGNELMGSLLGAGLLGTAAALSGRHIRRPTALCVFVLMLVLIFVFVGWPSLGANAGGAISTAAALAAVVFALSGRKPSWNIVLGVLLAVVLGAGVLFAADLLRGAAAQSHIGRLAESTAGGRLAGAVVVAQRKLALNLMLVSTSVWSKLLGLSIAASLAVYMFSRNRRRAGWQAYNQIDNAAMVGGSVAVAAAFIFNDSGVLAAAAVAVVLWSYLVLRSSELANAEWGRQETKGSQ
ncbi:MAG: hypothetical protein QHI38_02735 [Armatimonadota bacterium]|nr:hypothetical protein [Armatimonadota bacterium]